MRYTSNWAIYSMAATNSFAAGLFSIFNEGEKYATEENLQMQLQQQQK